MTETTDYVFERPFLGQLIDALHAQGYTTVGPTVRDGGIVYEEITCEDDLPIGWTEYQEAGHYRLERRDDPAVYGFTVGPHSWKKFLHPPRHKLFGIDRKDGTWTFEEEAPPPPRYAFIGVRSCELHAIAIQDRVFLGGSTHDNIYQPRRAQAFIVAVNCTVSANTCFCVSMKTGPKVTLTCDLALTEVIDNQSHYFICTPGTEIGQEILDAITHRAAAADERQAAEALIDATAQSMGRQLDTDGIKTLLYENAEHPRWDDVADRCLTCANCTLVCPTCFCSTVEEVTDLTGEHAERWRRWDSCFTMDFTSLHGGSVRQSARSRYRQWLTHKLASWHDQFQSSGCVGCGRCITWCPVGIDITEEVKAIRDNPQPKKQA